jgi:hypothetical protein
MSCTTVQHLCYCMGLRMDTQYSLASGRAGHMPFVQISSSEIHIWAWPVLNIDFMPSFNPKAMLRYISAYNKIVLLSSVCWSLPIFIYLYSGYEQGYFVTVVNSFQEVYLIVA